MSSSRRQKRKASTRNDASMIGIDPEGDLVLLAFAPSVDPEATDAIRQLEACQKQSVRPMFSMDGYDDDPREVYEIPEVIECVRKIVDALGSGWYRMLAEPSALSAKVLTYVVKFGLPKLVRQADGKTMRLDIETEKWRSF